MMSSHSSITNARSEQQKTNNQQIQKNVTLATVSEIVALFRSDRHGHLFMDRCVLGKRNCDIMFQIHRLDSVDASSWAYISLYRHDIAKKTYTQKHSYREQSPIYTLSTSIGH